MRIVASVPPKRVSTIKYKGDRIDVRLFERMQLPTSKEYMVDQMRVLLSEMWRAQRVHARERMVLDLFAKAFVRWDKEYDACNCKFRLTSIWQEVADDIKVISVGKYEYNLKGAEKVCEDREEIINNFLELLGNQFSRWVTYVDDVIKLYDPKYYDMVDGEVIYIAETKLEKEKWDVKVLGDFGDDEELIANLSEKEIAELFGDDEEDDDDKDRGTRGAEGIKKIFGDDIGFC